MESGNLMKYLNTEEWELDASPNEALQKGPESWGQWGARNIARTGANIASLAGIPGSLQQAALEPGYDPQTNLPLGALSEAEYMDPALLKEMLASAQQLKKEGLAYPEMKSPIPTLPSMSDVKGKIAEQFEPGYLEPKGTMEKFIDRFTVDVPVLAAAIGTGGLGAAPAVLGRAFAVNSAGQLAESAGLGPIGEIAAGIAASTLYDVKRGFGKTLVSKGTETKRIPKIEAHLRDIQKDLYNDVKVAGEKVSINGIKLEKDIQKELSKLETGASGLKKVLNKDVIDELEKVNYLVDNGKLNLTNAIEQKQHLNKLISNESNSIVRDYYTRAVGSINGAIQDSIEDYPEILKDFNRAENITKSLKNFRDTDGFLMSIYNDLNKTLSEPSLRNMFGLTLGKKFGIASRLLTNIDKRTLDLIKKTPEAKEYFSNIIKETFLHNKQNLIKNARGLNKILSSQETNRTNPQYLNLDEWELD